MLWYIWYLAIGLLYCLIHTIFTPRGSWIPAYELARKEAIAELSAKGHIQVERFGEREVVYRKSTWGELKLNALDSTSKIAHSLEENKNDFSLLFIVVVVILVVISVIIWPRSLYLDARRGISHLQGKSSL